MLMYTWWTSEAPRDYLWFQHNQWWLIWYLHLMSWQAWQILEIFYEIWRQQFVFWRFTFLKWLNVVYHRCSVVAEITLKQGWTSRANGRYIHLFTKTFDFQDYFPRALDHQFCALFLNALEGWHKAIGDWNHTLTFSCLNTTIAKVKVG